MTQATQASSTEVSLPASIAAVLTTETLVIGAGPAGLAVAASLVQRGRKALVIDQADQLGSSWRSHYERVHLHTVKSKSALPGMAFPDHYPRYVPRQLLVDYLVAYAERYEIAAELGDAATAITPIPGGWQTLTASGRIHVSRSVVVATGANCRPRMPALPGQDGFAGRVIHSRDYRNAKAFAGQRVLVVGMGNTGAEIALDLAEQGVTTAISVRSPINLVHRDVLGRPTQLTSMLLARLPTAWGDAIARLLRDLTVGDLSRWGLQTSSQSPLRQLREEGKTPVIDVGTLAAIRRGDIAVRPGITRFSDRGVQFSNGVDEAFDSVILATGYQALVERLFPVTAVELDRSRLPVKVIGSGDLAGIYFVGFQLREPGGLLRTIVAQAVQVAAAITLQPGAAAGR
jgi:cation diffusion facilitator CzcD-associated flavoprotein CzcO